MLTKSKPLSSFLTVFSSNCDEYEAVFWGSLARWQQAVTLLRKYPGACGLFVVNHVDVAQRLIVERDTCDPFDRPPKDETWKSWRFAG